MQLDYFHKLDSFWDLIKRYDSLYIEQMNIEELDTELTSYIEFLNP